MIVLLLVAHVIFLAVGKSIILSYVMLPFFISDHTNITRSYCSSSSIASTCLISFWSCSLRTSYSHEKQGRSQPIFDGWA